MVNIKDILDKKYDILRASLRFPNPKDKDKLLKSFKEVALEINEKKYNEYLEELDKYSYEADSLEMEKERLTKKINFINQYRDNWVKFNNDYHQITFSDLPDNFDDEDLIRSEERLDTIKEYLSNCNRINILEDSLNTLDIDLRKYTEEDEKNTVLNHSLEEKLLEYFMSLIKSDSTYSTYDYGDIKYELEKEEEVIKHKKEELDNFYMAYDSLENQILPENKKEEYKSYVEDAKRDYYDSKEKEYIYRLYELISNIETDYASLYNKREKISRLFDERMLKRGSLNINSVDNLKDLKIFIDSQYDKILSQKLTKDNILEVENRIEDAKEEIKALKERNTDVDILTILNEYKIIDTYTSTSDISKELDDNDNDDEEEEKEIETLDEEVNKVEDVADNEVVSVLPSYNIDLDKVKEISKEVMDEVISNITPPEEKEELQELELNDIFKDEEKKEDVVQEVDNIFPDIPLKEEAVDDFFSKEEKEILTDNLEEKEIDIPKIVYGSSSTIDDNPDITKLPNVENIGSVKPTNSFKDIKEKKSQITGLEVPTNGIIDKKEEIFKSSGYINNNNNTDTNN